jgi:hypothetical protein
LYDTLLEQNLLRIVEPYSTVEIDYVARQVGQGQQEVEAKYVSPPFLILSIDMLNQCLFQAIPDDP